MISSLLQTDHLHQTFQSLGSQECLPTDLKLRQKADYTADLIRRHGSSSPAPIVRSLLAVGKAAISELLVLELREVNNSMSKAHSTKRTRLAYHQAVTVSDGLTTCQQTTEQRSSQADSRGWSFWQHHQMVHHLQKQGSQQIAQSSE